MKKLFLTLVFCISSAFAADLNVFNESAKAWLGAINASTELRFEEPISLPNYGIIYSTSRYKKFSEVWTDNFAQIKGLTAALHTTLKGLEPTDYLTLFVTYTGDFGVPATQVMARIKASDLPKGIWEVWVNGKKQ